METAWPSGTWLIALDSTSDLGCRLLRSVHEMFCFVFGGKKLSSLAA